MRESGIRAGRSIARNSDSDNVLSDSATLMIQRERAVLEPTDSMVLNTRLDPFNPAPVNPPVCRPIR